MIPVGIKNDLRAKAILFVLLCSAFGIEMSIAQPAQFADSRIDLIQHWRAVVSTNVAAFLVEMDVRNLSSRWPLIQCSSFVTKMDDGKDKVLEIEANKLGREVLEALMAYPERLPELIYPESDLRTHRALIKFRNVLLDKLCYENLLLVDTINSVVFADLTRRIVVSEGVASTATKSVLESLQNYALDLASLEEISVKTFGRSQAEVETIELPTFRKNTWRPSLNIDEKVEMRIRKFYRLLIMTSGGNTIEDAFTSVYSADRYQLFDEPDMFSLLLLYRVTDSRIYRELPYLIESYAGQEQHGKNRSASAEIREIGTSISWPTGSKAGTAQRLKRLVNAHELDDYVGLVTAQKAWEKPQSSQGSVDVGRVLRDIQSVKAQLMMINGLQNGARITREEIEAYLLKKLPVPKSGGEYVVGNIGEAPRFVTPGGEVIPLSEE